MRSDYFPIGLVVRKMSCCWCPGCLEIERYDFLQGQPEIWLLWDLTAIKQLDSGAILAHIRNTKYSPFYNFYSQQIPSYTLSMRGRFWASTCFSIQWYLVCEDLYIQACYMKCTEYGENDQDGTVRPAYMVHGCKVNPLVWSIFAWSRTELTFC